MAQTNPTPTLTLKSRIRLERCRLTLAIVTARYARANDRLARSLNTGRK